jgi:hypothetical protein
LDATDRARVRRVSEEPRPVRWPGVVVAVQKAAASMKIAARKIKPPAAFAGPPGSDQKARVNSATTSPEMVENRLKNKTFGSVQVIIENQTL